MFRRMRRKEEAAPARTMNTDLESWTLLEDSCSNGVAVGRCSLLLARPSPVIRHARADKVQTLSLSPERIARRSHAGHIDDRRAIPVPRVPEIIGDQNDA